MSFQKIGLAAVAIPMLLLTPARAALITWDASPVTVDVNTPSQISTTGSFFAAATFGSTTDVDTGNGIVHFTNYLTAPHITFTLESYAQYGPSGTGYQAVVNTAGYISQSAPSVAAPSVISGLTPGYTYQIQLWSGYWNADWQTTFSSSSTGTTNLSPVLHDGVPTAYSGQPATEPQFILGTFVADSSSQNIYRYSPTLYSMMSAAQVRLIAVPEPSTVALGALGVCAMLFRLRRRQRVA